jgi:hypothetical protein
MVPLHSVVHPGRNGCIERNCEASFEGFGGQKTVVNQTKGSKSTLYIFNSTNGKDVVGTGKGSKCTIK